MTTSPYRLAAGALAGGCVLVALLRAALTLQPAAALPEARRQARTDPLTELANRRHLHERCARLLARPDAAPVTLLMIDLDGFKIVNDRHGHPVGDALLVEVATRLAATMRRDDLLGRLGGDEFAAILPRTTPLQARTVAQRMHAALAGPIVVAGHTIRDRRQRRHQRGRPTRHAHRHVVPRSRHRHVPGQAEPHGNGHRRHGPSLNEARRAPAPPRRRTTTGTTGQRVTPAQR